MGKVARLLAVALVPVLLLATQYTPPFGWSIGGSGFGVQPPIWFDISTPTNCTYYVSNVAGSGASDSNSGKSLLSPWLTIAKLNTIGTAAAGATVCLQRGSYWREQLDFGQLSPQSRSTLNYATVRDYGSLAAKLPTLDGADVIPPGSWTASGTGNAYFVTWTPALNPLDGGNNNNMPSLWQNGVRMQRVATLALCGSTPGTYYASTTWTAQVPANLYMNPTGGGNPNTNGNTYEQANRLMGLCLGNNATVANIHTKRNQIANGSLVLGDFATVSGVLVEDGNYHNMLIGSGTVSNSFGYLEDPWITVWVGAGAMFVAYSTTNNLQPVNWVNVIAAMTPTPASINTGFIGHGSPNAFSTFTYNGCQVFYANGAMSATNNTALVITNSLAYESGSLYADQGSTAPVTVSNSEFFQLTSAPTYVRGVFVSANPAAITITNTVFNFGDPALGGTGIWTPGAAAITCTNCSFYMNNSSAAYGALLGNQNNTSTSATTLSFSRSVFDGIASGDYGFLVNSSAGSTVALGTEDFNVIGQSTAKWQLGATSYANTAAYLAGVTPFESHSIVGAPGWAGSPAARNYAFTPGGNAATLGAGATITPIPVNYAALLAQLAAM